MTILAVDDEPMVRTLVTMVLQENGYTVLTADSGPRALALFREHSEEVDLLISDIVMPGMDGLSLATKLRTERPDLKVLLMSGYCQCEQISRGFEFLAKPFALAEIVAKVRTMLSLHESVRPVHRARMA